MNRFVLFGRPNVGKSSLYNRLVKNQKVIVSPTSGATRDWQSEVVSSKNISYEVVDLPGFEEKTDSKDYEQQILNQIQNIILSCQRILFVLDGIQGIISKDIDIAQSLRLYNIPVILVVNKSDSLRLQNQGDYFRLGYGSPVFVSAKTGQGMIPLSKKLLDVPGHASRVEKEDTKPFRISIIGQPNVGKSTLINGFIKKDRLITSSQSGTTRDPVAVSWKFKDYPLKIVDTAGLRKYSKVEQDLEKKSFQKALEQIKLCHGVILLMDATKEIHRMDLRIVGYTIKYGRSVVIGLNKWDLVKEKQQDYLNIFYRKLSSISSQYRSLSLIPISAKTGKNTHLLIKQVLHLIESSKIFLSTSVLNKWLRKRIHQNEFLNLKSAIKIKYVVQKKAVYPHFIFFLNKAQYPRHLKLFLQNQLRTDYNLHGVPIKVEMKVSKNPYVSSKK